MGFAAILAWISLNSYLTFDENYAYLPNTLMLSSQRVAEGLIGISPVIFGIAFFSTTIMFSHFKFKDFPNSCMTMFYIMNGDTQFDTVEGIDQVSYFYTFIWSYAWIWFGNNVIMNITLA